jgi:hypothetical protein
MRAWHLTFPVPVFGQWMVKLFVAAGLTIVLGFGTLVGWSLVGSHLWPSCGEFQDFTKPALMGNAAALELVAMAVALYASSITRDSMRGFLAAGALFFVIAVTAASAEPFMLTIRRTAGAVVEQMAEATDFSWALTRRFSDYAMPILIVLAGLPFLLSSFLSYRTIDRSMRRLWVGAVVAFVPGMLIFLLMLALSGAIEIARASRASGLRAEVRSGKLYYYGGPESRRHR